MAVLSNGAITDDRGRIIANPPGGPTTAVRTTSQAVALARRRYDLAAQRAREAMQAEVAASGRIDANLANTPTRAWGQIVGHMAELAMATDSARGAADLAAFVGRATQMLPDRATHDDVAQAAPAMPDNTDALMLVAMYVRVGGVGNNKAGQGKVVDSKVIE
jgi:hypothetical protein